MKQMRVLTLVLAISTLMLALGCMPGPPSPSTEAVQFCHQQGGRSEGRLTALRVQKFYCAFPDGSVCEVEAFHQGSCQLGAQPTPMSTQLPPLVYTSRYTDTTLGVALPHPEHWAIDFAPQRISLEFTTEFWIEAAPVPTDTIDLEVALESIRQGDLGPHITAIDSTTIDGQPAFLLQVNPFSRPQAAPLYLAVVVTPCARARVSFEYQTRVLYQFVEQPLIISAKEMDLPLFEQFLQHLKLHELSPAC